MVRSHYDPPDQESTDELSAFFVPSASGESRPVGMGRAHHVLRLPTLGRGELIQHPTRKGVNVFLTIREVRMKSWSPSIEVYGKKRPIESGYRPIQILNWYGGARACS